MNGPERVAVGERRERADRHVAEPRAQRLDRLGVVGMVVRQRDPARAAALRDRGGDRVEVRVERRARSTTHAGSRPTTQLLVPSSV